jgi:Protein of unknown function (DUF3275)
MGYSNSTPASTGTTTAQKPFTKKQRQFEPVWLDGVLMVSTRSGRYGEFRVAKLDTGLGEFAVKDLVLEQYDPGVYTGRFLVGLIRGVSNNWRGGIFFEVRAYLDELMIDAQDQLAEGDCEKIDLANKGPVVDPLEQERIDSPSPASRALESSFRPATAVPPAAPANEEELLIALGFVRALDVQEGRLGKDDKGDQIAAVLSREPVALDAKALDREALRKQRDYLKGIGYRFISTGQYWAIVETE